MATATLEERVSTLERLMARLLSQSDRKGESMDWRLAIGKFPNDEGLKDVDAAGAAIREADRRAARRGEGAAQ